jgi:hypothetical protein
VGAEELVVVELWVATVEASELVVELCIVAVDELVVVELESARNAPAPAMIKITTIITTTKSLPMASSRL